MHHRAPPHSAADDASDPVAAPSQDEEYLLSEREAALAATLALMTGFAHGCCAAHKGPIAAKVADQLGALVQQMQGPECSPDMQALLLRLRTRWSAAAAHHTETHLDAMRRQLDSQLRAQAQQAASAAMAPAGSNPSLTPPLTPGVLWHAPLETLQ